MTINTITPQKKELINKYKQEAYAHLADIETAKTHLKETVEAAASGGGVDKKVISAYFTASYKDTLKELSEKNEVIQFLAE